MNGRETVNRQLKILNLQLLKLNQGFFSDASCPIQLDAKLTQLCSQKSQFYGGKSNSDSGASQYFVLYKLDYILIDLYNQIGQ